MRRLSVVVSALLTLAATAAHAQESVLLRVGGQPGQVARYRRVIETFVRGGPMAGMASADTTLPMSRITLHATRTLQAVTGDTMTFAETVDSGTFDSPAMPQMAQALGPRTMQPLLGRTTVTKTDARARIFSQVASSAQGGAGGGGRGAMGGGGGGPDRAMLALPAAAVRVGDSWSDSTTVPPDSAGAGGSTTVATFKLERLEVQGGARIAVISMNGRTMTNAANGPQNFALTGDLQFDVSARRLSQMNMTLTGTASTPQGDVSLKVHITNQLM